MKAASKYRHSLGKPQKKELWYPDLRPNGSSTDVTMIKASCKFIAVNWSSASAALAILNLDQPGKRKGEPSLIHAHSGQLTDFDFSPFDDALLATSADDAHIKLWKIPEGGLTTNLSTSQADLSGHKKSIDTIAYHPTANHVLVSGSADKVVKLWDLEKAQEKSSLELLDGIQSVCWNYDGSLIATTSKDKKIRTIDPRSNTVVSEGEGHVGQKAMRVVWLGNTPRFLTTGFSKTRERQYAVWDSTDLSKPLKLTTLDSSTGVISPIYDVDTNILFFAGGGDSGVRAFEVTEDPKNFISELTSVAGDLPQKGIAWVPKRAVDVMDVEVARLLRLTQQAIVPVSFNVPRKTKSKFADDLFPPTAGPQPALSADQWFAGETKTPILVSLDPESRAKYSSSSSASSPAVDAASSPSSSSSSGVVSPPLSRTLSPSPAASPINSPALRGSSDSPQMRTSDEGLSNISRTGVMPKVVRSSKYRHILGKPVKKTLCYDNVKAHGATSNTVVKANRKFFAVPWSGVGGLLAVLPHSQTGRLPPSVPCFEAGSTLLDFDMHPFNDNLIVTGDEGAHVKIWDVPEAGLRAGAKNTTTPVADLLGHTRKLCTVNFHPSADNILFTTGADLVLKTWDLSKQAVASSLPGHTDIVLGISVNYQGNLIASSCRDKIMRIIDSRAGKVTSETQGHAGTKGSRVSWLGNKPYLFSVGFGKASDREAMMWDTRNFTTPTTTLPIDQLSGVITPYYDEDTGVMFLAGRGDGSIKMFEIVDEEPYIHYLTEYSSSVPQMGIAPLPKQLLDIRGCEIARFLKVSDTAVEPIQMTVPRTRTDFFQDDIFPPTRAIKPAFSAEEWLAGGERDPPLESLLPAGMTPLSQAPVVEKKSSSKIVSGRDVDATPSKDQVMSKFYQQTMSFKEAETTTTTTTEDDNDDEWA